MCRSLLDGVILVDNTAISAAIKDVFNETRSILEPAGAVAVAGAKAYLSRQGLQVATQLCGASAWRDRGRLGRGGHERGQHEHRAAAPGD